MTIHPLVSRFPDAKRVGEGWTAKCPAHDDKRASLSIGEGAEGRALVTCHAGCDLDTILGALQLTRRDLFATTSATAKSTIAAVYPYHDETGRHLFDVCRFEPKDFRQRRADGVWSMQGVRRVLYGLPELLDATDVFIVEGERDVHSLRGLGLTATTNAGGAGKWTDNFTQQLVASGAQRLNILPDNDEPGRKHAEQVAHSCHAAGLAVKVVTLPGLPPKGDVSDYLAAGHTRADLEALVQVAPLWTPDAATEATATTPTRQPVVTFLHTVEPQAVDWIWPSRLARGKYTLVSGEPGLGKTFVALDISARVTRGATLPDGTRAALGRVLLLTAEDGLADTIRPRIDSLGGDPSRMAVLEAVREADGTRSAVSLTRDMTVLAQAIEQVRPDIVWIDPVTAYLGKTDSHRDAEVRATLAPLLDLIAQRGCALGAIGHLSKDSQRAALHRPGGSIAFVAAARIVLGLASDPNDPQRRLLAPLKSNICRPAPTLAYRIDGDRLVWEAGPVLDMDADAIFAAPNLTDRAERTDAEAVVTDLLAEAVVTDLLAEADWPLDAKKAIEAGHAHGIPDRTMRHTAKRLGIRIARLGFGGGGKWVWHRPEPIPATVAATSPEHPNVAAMAPMRVPSEKLLLLDEKCSKGQQQGALGTTDTEAGLVL